MNVLVGICKNQVFLGRVYLMADMIGFSRTSNGKNWVEDLVIAKTFNGMYVQKAILASLAERNDTTYRLATPEEESVGIDGYVGNVPYSVKPDTYKTMGRLSETIAVKMIYYTKTKTGLTIEVEE